MKVLFSNPPWFETQPDGSLRLGVRAGSRWPFTYQGRSTPDNFVWGCYLPYPQFLGAAATYLQANVPDCTVHFRDSIALRESWETFWMALVSGKYDFLFIESASPSWDHDASMIEYVLEKHWAGKVVICGPIATRGQQLVDYFGPDVTVIKGEYEHGSVRVVNGESGVIDFDFLSEEEMNASPPPYMDATYAPRYWDVCPAGQKSPQLHLWTSRGCWAKCQFCVFPAAMTSNDPDGNGKRTVRHYHAAYLRSYLQDVLPRYRFKSIWVDDDLFNTSERHVLETCEVLAKTGLPWSAMCRADRMKRSTWQAMKDAGCFAVKVGMESASQRVLDEIINKQLDLSEAYQTLAWLKEIGMTVHTTWSIGHPGETKAEQKQTVEAIDRLYKQGFHQTHQLSGTASIEGTPLATIGTGKLLKKYPGAKLDADYIEMGDGAKKLEAMRCSK